MPREVEVQGHRWAYVGGPIGALAASQELARVMGPVGLSMLQQVMVSGTTAAVQRLVELAKEETTRRQAEAIASLPNGAGPDVLGAALGAVREVMGHELAGQVLAAVTGPDFKAWASGMLSQMTRDGKPVDPADPDVSGGEFMAALWEVGRAEAVFR